MREKPLQFPCTPEEATTFYVRLLEEIDKIYEACGMRNVVRCSDFKVLGLRLRKPVKLFHSPLLFWGDFLPSLHPP